MAGTKSDVVQSLIQKLQKLWEELLDVGDEIEKCHDLWVKDGDSKHSDTCFKKFIKLLSEFYAVQDLVSAAESPFIKNCSVRESMEEMGAELERCLSMAVETRAKYKRDRMFYDLEARFANAPEDNDEPVDDTIERLLLDDDKVANLSMSILCLENSWLREQKMPEQVPVPNTELTDTESNILEALGDATLTGPELLKKAGYDNNSHFRSILSNLVKRRILQRCARGYYNPREVQEDPTHL